ncbi:MAG TPA: hypothetical protein GYA08_01830 [Chloroflexi bacterium]|nr:hypothetical protein [Chloroflexota bacterium]
MTIILERYSIPETGDFEIRQRVTLAISAEQARRLVNRFLLMDVSTMLAAETPDLVIGERTVWRAPVWIGFLHQGRYAVGSLDVDAQTGAILDQEQSIAMIRARATEIAATLPPYRPNPKIAAEYLAPNPVSAQNP